MKNVYIVETIETCKVWKQYEVEAYTIEDAKRIVMGGDFHEQPRELDHYIDHDIEINDFVSVKHCGTTQETV